MVRWSGGQGRPGAPEAAGGPTSQPGAIRRETGHPGANGWPFLVDRNPIAALPATITPAMARRIKIWPTDRLAPCARNARTHSAEQVALIAASIVEFGFNK